MLAEKLMVQFYISVLKQKLHLTFSTDGVYIVYTSSVLEIAIKKPEVLYNYSQLLLCNWKV